MIQLLAETIPVNRPAIGEREAEYVLECLRGGWISSEGPYVRRFEEEWARYCGAAHGVAMSSGTAALFAACDAVGLGPGDEVIMPTFTIISCAHAILATGATPVLVDSEPLTWCMDVEQVASRITPRTRAIMAVHIYGHPVDMAPLRELARRHGLTIIEDAAEAHGATYRGARTGALGDVGCFSFYANKIITTGEGGMLVTDDEQIAARAREYRNLAFRSERRFYHTATGYNHRMTSMQAALGLAQIEDIDGRVARKRATGARYNALLRDVRGITLPAEMPWATNVYWMYGIVLDETAGIDAAEMIRALGRRGIEARPFFLGMHEQPVFTSRGLFEGETYPVAERIASYGLYLPSSLDITDGEIERVAGAVREELAS